MPGRRKAAPELGQFRERYADRKRARTYSLPPEQTPGAACPASFPTPPERAAPGPAAPVRPLGSFHHVRLTREPDRTEGGIYLPEDCSLRRQQQDGFILASGPGKEYVGLDGLPFKAIMWADPGDRVLFPAPAFHPLPGAPGEGFVADWDLIADLAGDLILPLNDLVLCREDPPPPAVLIRPDAPPSTSGVVLTHGPGELRHQGPLAGTRQPVHQIVGFPERRPLWRQRVRWDGAPLVFCPDTEGGDLVLVRARDLIALVEEEEPCPAAS